MVVEVIGREVSTIYDFADNKFDFTTQEVSKINNSWLVLQSKGKMESCRFNACFPFSRIQKKKS